MSVLTGLCDSKGASIRIGDILRKPTECSDGPHGGFVYFRVAQRGMTPVMIYETSETGHALPKGMSGCALCDEYDQEEFIRAPDLTEIRPVDQLEVVR